MELTIQSRDITGKKVQALRKASLIPAVIYGKHLAAPIKISCDKNAFIKAYKQGGSATAINLKGDGIKELALVQDVQLDPVNDYVLHIDFHAVKADEKVSVEVPVILTGSSSVEKLGEGKVQLVKDTVEVEAFPQDLPHDITIDISNIESINDVIFVKDITVSSKVTVLTDPEQALVTVVVIEDEVESSDENVDPAGNAIAAQKEAAKSSEGN
jgi:large subunit ribosomal protein L25